MTSKLHIYDYWWLFQKSGQWNSHVWWQFIFINYFENCDARKFALIFLTLSWLKSLLYKNQSIDLLCKSVDWFLYDTDLLHERVKVYWRTQKRQGDFVHYSYFMYASILLKCVFQLISVTLYFWHRHVFKMYWKWKLES